MIFKYFFSNYIDSIRNIIRNKNANAFFNLLEKRSDGNKMLSPDNLY